MQTTMQLTSRSTSRAPIGARVAGARRAARTNMRISAVQVGDKAPGFKLKDQNGKDVSLSKFQGFLGAKNVVLYFYPKDGTPGCTREAQAFKDAYGEFKKLGAEVIGVSSDSVESHKEFKTDLDLPFTLLSDEDGEVRKEYGVGKDLFGFLEGRETYVIDKKGVVQLKYNDQFGPEKHVEKALEALTADVTVKA